MSDSTTKFLFYHYTPSLAAAVIFVLLFFTSALLHTFQLFKNRTWYFIPFLIGAFCKYFLTLLILCSTDTVPSS